MRALLGRRGEHYRCAAQATVPASLGVLFTLDFSQQPRFFPLHFQLGAETDDGYQARVLLSSLSLSGLIFFSRSWSLASLATAFGAFRLRDVHPNGIDRCTAPTKHMLSLFLRGLQSSVKMVAY